MLTTICPRCGACATLPAPGLWTCEACGGKAIAHDPYADEDRDYDLIGSRLRYEWGE